MPYLDFGDETDEAFIKTLFKDYIDIIRRQNFDHPFIKLLKKVRTTDPNKFEIILSDIRSYVKTICLHKNDLSLFVNLEYVDGSFSNKNGFIQIDKNEKSKYSLYKIQAPETLDYIKKYEADLYLENPNTSQFEILISNYPVLLKNNEIDFVYYYITEKLFNDVQTFDLSLLANLGIRYFMKEKTQKKATNDSVIFNYENAEMSQINDEVDIQKSNSSYDAFISYKRGNIKMAELLRNNLRKNGFTCFVDKHEIKMGTHWEDKITEAIVNSTVFLVLLTDDLNENPLQVSEEIDIARYNEKRIVVYKITKAKYSTRLQKPLVPLQCFEAYNYDPDKVPDIFCNELSKIIFEEREKERNKHSS